MDSNRGNISIFLVILLTAIITSLATYFIIINNNNLITEKSQLQQIRKANACKINGERSADQFLDDYIVKPGDSILLIAKNQLGDPARITELSMLNLLRYPGFYRGPGQPNLNPFLEVGWVLKVPPKWMPRTSGNLVTLNGLVIESTVPGSDDDFGISGTAGEEGRYSSFKLDNDTINSKRIKIKIGDCATLLRDNVTFKTIKIDTQ